jgi:hypothetical protein
MTNPERRRPLTPEEREKEHVRRLQEEVDAVKSGVLRRGLTDGKPEPDQAESKKEAG